MSYIELTADETKQFRLRLEYSLIDKNKHIKKNLAANFESLPDKVTENLEDCKCEYSNEYSLQYSLRKTFTQLVIIPIRTKNALLMTQTLLLFLLIKNHVLLS